MGSLRRYLVSVAVLLVLLTGAAATVLLYQVDQYGQAETRQQQLATARALSLVVDGQLRRYEAYLQALAVSRELEQEDWPALDRRARRLLSGPGAWITVGDRSGRQLVNTRLPPGATLPGGKTRPEMWAVLDRGQTRICNLVHGRIEPNIVCIDVPVMRAGHARYHLSVVMRPDALRVVTDAQHLPAGAYGTILDRNYRLIWRNVDAKRYLGRQATPDLIRSLASSGENVRESRSLDGVPTIMAYSRSPLSGWTFVSAVPRSQVGAGIGRALGYGAVAALLLLCLGITSGLVAARRVTLAIGRLSTATARIGAGTPPDFEPSGLAEIDQVGRALEAAVEARDLSEERLALAQEVGGIGTWTWDVVADHGYVSESYRKMHGLPPGTEPLSLAQVKATIHPDDLDAYSDRLAEARERSEASSNHYRVVHPDGSVHWIAAKGRPLFAEQGRYVQAVGIVRDITLEHEQDQALRESQERLALATEAAEVGIWDYDPVSGRLLLSDRACEIFGQPPGTVPQVDAIGGLIQPEDRERLKGHFLHALDPEMRDRRPIDFRISLPGGETRWIRAHGGASFNREKAVRYVGALIDISERVRAEEDLKRLNALLADRVEERTAERDRLWTLSPDPFMVSDLDGVWRAASPAWTSLLGWETERLIGRTIEWLLHPDDRAHVDAERAALAEGKVSREFVSRLRAKDGRYLRFAWTSIAEDDRIYSVARDVTEEKERAEALRKAEEALRQSQKMESIGQITGGLAHDFNNLLSPILGTLDLIQRRGLPDASLDRLVNGAIDAAERARMLVRRLLAFARRQPLQTQAVDVRELIGTLMPLLETTLGRTVSVKVEESGNVPPALVDSNQLELAILNLTVNARDAMPDGGQLVIALRHDRIEQDETVLAAGDYVQLALTDNGMGMPSSVLERAIEPFFSTKASERGTGLGLSMVHGLAAQLGGGMRIESEPGRGTTVRLWLPTAEPVPDREASAVRPPPEGGFARGTALLVDDEALVRINTAHMLGELGYRVLEAGSGDEALRMFESGTAIDLVVTDHFMPGISGSELAEMVRRRRPATPVLIISGYADISDIAPHLPRLSKPFRQSELAQAIAALHARAAGGGSILAVPH